MFINRWIKIMAKVDADEALVTELGDMIDSAAGGAGDSSGKKTEKKEKKEKKEENIEEDLDDDDHDEGEDDEDSDEEEFDEEEEDEESEDDEEDEEDEGEEEDEEDDEEDEDEESSEMSQLLEQNRQMMKIILDQNKKPKEKKKAEPKVDPFESEEFTNMVEELDWEDKEVSSFKKFFTMFSKNVHNNTIDELMEKTPHLINKTISSTNKVQRLKEKFYEDNPALVGVKTYVSAIATEIAKAKGEGATLENVLKETAKKVYKDLKIKKVNKSKKKSSKSGKGKKKKPAFAKGGGSRKKLTSKKKKGTGVQNQINEMIETLDK